MTDETEQPEMTNIVKLADFRRGIAGTLSEHSAAVAFVDESRDRLLYDHHRGAWFE